eukprot:5359646-Pleurochrysis_carterae.AAC.1
MHVHARTRAQLRRRASVRGCECTRAGKGARVLGPRVAAPARPSACRRSSPQRPRASQTGLGQAGSRWTTVQTHGSVAACP